jgi:2-polyprenyl-3-methyl-5-hydroxy-6-metoxy-1,4-benzoquinol methylase
MSKQAERDYADRVEPTHLYQKPFAVARILREFAVALDHLQHCLPAGAAILDLGCGSGWTSIFLAKAGFDVTGLDISDRMIAIARERADQEHAEVAFVVGDMEELELDRHDFDGVLLFDALHHCPRFPDVLRRAHRHLRQDGFLLLLEPSLLHLYSPHARATTRRYGVTELGFSRNHLNHHLRGIGFRHLTQCYDSGNSYRGFAGFVRANLRLWCSYFCCYPQVKQIILAQK